MRPWPSDVVALGGDYNPEQWPREVWREDVELMQRAGVTFATVGVFSWSWLEPEPGRYEFGWLDEVLDLLHGAGVAVDLATGTASPPPWFSHQYPDSLPVRSDGARLWHGSRQAYCPSSTVFTEHAVALAEQMARRYHDHPALAMWHVSQRVRLPQPPVLLRHLRRRLPRVADGPPRRPRRPQRGLGHGVLEPALHRVRAGRSRPASPRPSPTRRSRWTSGGSARTPCSPSTWPSATSCTRCRPACRSPRTS